MMNEEFDMKEFWDFTSDSIGELRKEIKELQVKQEDSETTIRRLAEETRQLRINIG